MSGLAFDTLAYSRRMEQAGFTRTQAEAMADEQAKLIDERLATKADIARIEAALEAQKASLAHDIEALRASLTHDMEALRTSLTHDMEALRTSVTHDLERMRLTTKAEVAEILGGFRADILKWMLGVAGLQTVVLIAALFGLVKALLR